MVEDTSSMAAIDYRLSISLDLKESLSDFSLFFHFFGNIT